MKNRIEKIGLVGILLFLGLAVGRLKAQERPNILWINCDDLGRELACYGNPDVYTPNIDKLASQGVLFENGYANAPVCSPSRSSMITGVYPTAINSVAHRTIDMQELPGDIVPVMDLFRKAGYFCTNGSGADLSKPGKKDYNFLGNTNYDGTDWAQRKPGQPFFAQVQIKEPHRDFEHDQTRPIDFNKVHFPSCYPDVPLLRADWTLYLESVQIADQRVGMVLDRLEKEGLADNTVVILFGDNGRPHLRDKQWLYEAGLAVPVIVRFPAKFKAGKTDRQLIELVDVTASSLALAGIPIPKYMHGKNVLGGEKRQYVFGFRERCGDADDDIRSITDGRYKLIWNRMPEKPYMQLSSYKKMQYPANSYYKVMYEAGKLPAPYSLFMREPRPEFEFYDLKNDPDEFKNLAGDKKLRKVQQHLFSELQKMLSGAEKGMIAESPEIIENAINSSAKYFEEGMVKRGLPANVTDEELLKWWEQELIK